MYLSIFLSVYLVIYWWNTCHAAMSCRLGNHAQNYHAMLKPAFSVENRYFISLGAPLRFQNCLKSHHQDIKHSYSMILPWRRAKHYGLILLLLFNN